MVSFEIGFQVGYVPINNTFGWHIGLKIQGIAKVKYRIIPFKIKE